MADSSTKKKAKKENSTINGNLIQFKRIPELTFSEDSDVTTIDSYETLAIGEPLFALKDGYFLIGDGSTPTSELPVFSSVKRTYTDNQVFYTNYNQDSKLVQLSDKLGNDIFSKLRYFGSYKISANGSWKAVNSDGSLVVPNEEVGTTSVFPKAQVITITGMTEEIVPIIKLHITNYTNGTIIKNEVSAFSAITNVASFDSYILVYAGYKNVSIDCTIDVFGG